MDQLSYGTMAVVLADGVRRHALPETIAEAERLEASIERAVRRETQGGVRNLRVEVSRTAVMLRGCCRNFYTKQKAQHAAMGVSGNRDLTNRIEVV